MTTSGQLFSKIFQGGNEKLTVGFGQFYFFLLVMRDPLTIFLNHLLPIKLPILLLNPSPGFFIFLLLIP